MFALTNIVSSVAPGLDTDEESPWTVVDVGEANVSGADDSDGSVVHVSRVPSPVTVSFSSLSLDHRASVQIPWPSSLPWFQFQDHYLNSEILRKLLSQRHRVLGTPPGVGKVENSVMLSSNQLQKLTAEQGIQNVACEISKFMPESQPEENIGRVKALVGDDPTAAKLQEIQLFAYQLANNLIEDEDDEYIDDEGKYTKIMKAFRGVGLPLSVWKEYFSQSLEQPTGRAFMKNLFEAAVSTLSLDLCETLIESGADPDNIIYSWMCGQSVRPIQHAVDCRVRSLELVKLLIRFGATADLVTEDNPEPALHNAAKECTLDEVRVLVEAGASLGGSSEDTALTNAVTSDYRSSYLTDEEQEARSGGKERRGLDTLRYLLPLYDRERDHDIIQSAFIAAAGRGRKDMFQLLLDAGADVNEHSVVGHTPLIAATQASYKNNGVSVASALLDLGADPNLAFNRQGTFPGICPIHIAAATGEDRLVQLLIDRGAEINSRASPRTEEHASLLGSHFVGPRTTPWRSTRNPRPPSTPLHLALYKYVPYSGVTKNADGALALLRAGATLTGGELARAAVLDSPELSGELLSRGADINETDPNGLTALQNCLKHQNIKLVQYLLEAGAVLKGGELLGAVRTGCRKTVDLLLSHGVTEGSEDQTGLLLEAAAMSKNWELMEWLMKSYEPPYDEFVLCTAVCSGIGDKETGNKEVLLGLLKRRPLGKHSGLLEATALGYAAFWGQRRVVDSLLKLHVKGPCIVSVDGELGHYSLAAGYTLEVKDAYKKDSWRHASGIRCSVLVPAILGRSWKSIWQLLRAGVRPDRWSLLVAMEVAHTSELPDDWTAEDIKERRENSLDLVLRLTKRMELADLSGSAAHNVDTPLQAAARWRRPDIIRHLIGLGVDVNAPPSTGIRFDSDWRRPLLPRTALQAAVERGDLETIELLIDAGADVNAPAGRDSGATALQLAAGNGHIGIARRLMSLGADVNANEATLYGRTALEAAAEGGRLDMVQFLLESGARMSQYERGSGKNMFHWAIKFAKEKGHDTIARLLRAWRKRIEEGREVEGVEVWGLSSGSSEEESIEDDDEGQECYSNSDYEDGTNDDGEDEA
ncbi:uncharacterized protein DNG_02566 [Cephalotrichum gorgonifer]|uniref:Uncharacterized protein n=1 Tax=Cephalotrichum gorgonifer TaxID=2041049 RepID=A0AAE8MTG5_9PEZI|nr:uncharacterized protein DNG_02566 [Cephalotrichum gorgonifer]